MLGRRTTLTSLHRGTLVRALALVVPLATGGCVGQLGDDGGDKNGGGPTEETTAAPAPLARLSSVQYGNTLRDLFAPVSVPDEALPADVIVEGFDNNTSTQNPSSTLIDALHSNAVDVATTVMAHPTEVLGCSPSSREEEDACASAFVTTFLKRAFRRPVTDEEIADHVGLYTSNRSDGTTDFATAMTLVIEMVLQEPDFLYRVEVGTPIDGLKTRVALTDFEVANRLSYLLWNTMPDDTLFDAASTGQLTRPDGVESEARRMLEDPRAHAAVLKFHEEWLRFSKLDNLSKDPTLFPAFGPSTAASMRASASRFVESSFFDDGSLTTLLTDSHAWVNDDLAPIYGVAAPGSSDLSLVSVDPSQRSGILTDAGLMAGFAHETADSPVLRGVWVLDRLICNVPPPPTGMVNMTPPAATTGDPMTTRDLFATQHEQGTCQSCHHTIDGIGFAFEHYDAVGAWRTTDNGLPVDSSGWFADGYQDLDGTFDGAVELGQKLAQSPTVQACVASSWLRYALGVDHTGIDEAGLAPILDDFEKSELDMRELVVALAKSDAFRTRPVPQP